MSAWIVSHVPAGLLLVVLIVLISGGAVLLQRMLRRRFPALTGEEHNDVTKFTYGFIGFVYAFFIGFVVSSMWGQINTADANARAEGAAAVQLGLDAGDFDQADADRIRAGLLGYANAAVAEWPDAAAGRTPAADAALADLKDAYRQVRATTDQQTSALAASRSNLDKVSQARTVRIMTARQDDGPPWPLWAVIFLTSAMVLGTVVIYGVERPALHYPTVVIVGAIVATNLFLIVELAHPYIGDIATSPDSMTEVVSVLSR
ncbi:hypothetical protein JDV09_21825 [Mycobacterium sp. Y57]|uniref:bestrophin-like domain n=1 Tax=Mycolicibacterium xanthum TaxID=2796469 RepID=UPI001C85B6B4|nr:hypothetical protein [Mycolicibacterium xanthum]MBX7434714.1 hypothetical protein [Mycolicibacterium xanthum]